MRLRSSKRWRRSGKIADRLLTIGSDEQLASPQTRGRALSPARASEPPVVRRSPCHGSERSAILDQARLEAAAATITNEAREKARRIVSEAEEQETQIAAEAEQGREQELLTARTAGEQLLSAIRAQAAEEARAPHERAEQEIRSYVERRHREIDRLVDA